MRYRMRAAGLAAICGFATVANAETLRWVGPPGGSWTEPGHWSPPKIPSEGDRLLFEIEGAAAIDFDFEYLTARSAVFRAGTTTLLGDTINEQLILLEEEPLNPPALTVADTPGAEALVESEVSLHAPSAAIGVEGDGVWSTQAEMRVDDMFIGVRPGASGVASLRGTRAVLQRRFNEPMNRVTVGFQGDGAFELHDGATADITELRLGVEPGSHGEILVDGADSAVTFESLTLGAGAATIAARNGGAVRFPDGLFLEDAPGPSGTLTFDGVAIDNLRQIDFLFGRHVRVRNGSALHLTEAIEVGGLDVLGPTTRVTTQVIRASGAALIADGAEIEVLSRDYFGIPTAAFRGGLEIDGGRLFIDRVAEGGRPSILAVGSFDGPSDQRLRLVNGALIDAEGLIALSFNASSEVRGEGAVIRQRTHLVGGPFPSSPTRQGGKLQLVTRRLHSSDPFVRLDIAEGALVRGTSVELGAEVHVGDAALIADEVMIIVLSELVATRDADIRTPRLLVGDSEQTPSGTLPILRGDGSVSAAVSNGGVIDPGLVGAVGSLQVAGSLHQARHVVQLPESYLPEPFPRRSGEGLLHIDIAGETDHDTLEVTGDALLGGTLRLELRSGFTPSWGDAFSVLTAGAIDGAFETLEAPKTPPGLVYEIDYTDTAATLVVHNRIDLTRDLRIDGADLAALLTVWKTTDDRADLNADGVVDGADLGVLLGAWGLQAN